MKLIVGLGNPGTQYERTRHNAGFMAVDRVAQKFGGTNFRTVHESFACDVFIASQKVMLLKPLTYMNLSGRTVASAMSYYKLALADLLVVVDDIALPVGTLRLRASGSAGGHNGLLDIQAALTSFAAAESAGGGTAKLPVDYARLRIGIDPPGRVPQKAYVLTAFTEEQKPLIDKTLTRAVDAVATWVEYGIERAMNKFNGADPE